MLVKYLSTKPKYNTSFFKNQLSVQQRKNSYNLLILELLLIFKYVQIIKKTQQRNRNHTFISIFWNLTNIENPHRQTFNKYITNLYYNNQAHVLKKKNQNMYKQLLNHICKHTNRYKNNTTRTSPQKKYNTNPTMWKTIKSTLRYIQGTQKRPHKKFNSKLVFQKLLNYWTTQPISIYIPKKKLSNYKIKKKMTIQKLRSMIHTWQNTNNNKKQITTLFKNQHTHSSTTFKRHIINLYNLYKTKRILVKNLKNQSPSIEAKFNCTNRTSQKFTEIVTNLKKIKKRQTQYFKPIVGTTGLLNIDATIKINHFNQLPLNIFLKKKTTALESSRNNVITMQTNHRYLKNFYFETLFNFDSKTPQHVNLNYFPNVSQLCTTEFIMTRYNFKTFNTLFNATQKKYSQIQKNIAHTTSIDSTLTKKNMSIHKFNNYTPLFLFARQANTKSITESTRIRTQNYYYTISSLQAAKYKNFFNFFLINFLEKFLLKKIWIRFATNDPFTQNYKNYINTFCDNYNHLYKRFNRLIAVRELLEILVLTLSTHDLQIFLMFLKRKFEHSHFKKHRKILSILFDVIRKNPTMFAEFNVKGFFFDIRGKVGVSGNAKKRHTSFSIGKITTTSQNVKSYWQQINVWTPTGQMGITCYILF